MTIAKPAAAPDGFSYTERTVCACGRPLEPGAEVIEKPFGWGMVRFARCPACGSWAQSPQIVVSSLARWYDSADYQSAGSQRDGAYLDYAAEEEQRRVEAQHRYRRDLAPLLPKPARVLEVGSATGSLLRVLREHGHQATGIDISASFVEQARTLNGVEVHNTDFLEFERLPGSFDLILIVGSLSNLQDLPRHLAHAARLLAAEGWLFVNVPVADAWPARLYGSRHWMFAPSASNFLTTAGCRAALEAAGFAVERVTTDRQRPTVAKLLGHAQLRGFFPAAKRLGLAGRAAPCALPIPGVKAFLARKRDEPAKPFAFIVGCPRSGTSLVATILAERIAVPYETHFIPLFERFLPFFGDLGQRSARRRLLDAIWTFLEIWTESASMGRPLERLRRISLLAARDRHEAILDRSRSYPELVEGIYAEYADIHTQRRLGDKSAFFHHVPLERLQRSVQRPRIVHIVRDGRDVCVSWTRGWYGPLTVAEAARVWARHVAAKRHWGRRHPDLYLEVRYEDLLQGPRAVLSRVCAFLDVPYDDRLLEFHTSEFARVFASGEPHQLMSAPLVSGNREKWRAEMTPSDQRLFEHVAGRALASSGYPIGEKAPSAMERHVLFPARIAWSFLRALVSYRHTRLRLKAVLPLFLWLSARLRLPLPRIRSSGAQTDTVEAPRSRSPWVARLMALGVFVAAVAAFAWTAPPLEFFLRSPDHASNIGLAALILNGQFPFVDHVHFYGPLAALASAWAYRVHPSLLSEIALCAAAYALAIALLFRSTATNVGRSAGILVALVAFACSPRFYKYYYWLMPMLALHVLERAADAPVSRRGRAWFFAGSVAGIAGLFRFDLGLALFVFLIVCGLALASRPPDGVPHAGWGWRFAVGFSLPWLAWLAALVVKGGGQAVADYMVGTFQGAAGYLANRRLPGSAALNWTTAACVACYVLALGLGGVGFWRGSPSERRRDGYLAAAGLLGLGLVPQTLHRREFSHLLQASIPLFAALPALLRCLMSGAVQPGTRLPMRIARRAIAVLLVAVLSIAGFAGRNDARVDLTPFDNDVRAKYRRLSDGLDAERAGDRIEALRRIRTLTRPDDRLLVLGNSAWVYYFVQRPLSGLFHNYVGVYAPFPRWRQRNLDEIRAHPPALVVAAPEDLDASNPLALERIYPEVAAYVDRNYPVVVYDSASIVVLAREADR